MNKDIDPLLVILDGDGKPMGAWGPAGQVVVLVQRPNDTDKEFFTLMGEDPDLSEIIIGEVTAHDTASMQFIANLLMEAVKETLTETISDLINLNNNTEGEDQ